MIFWSLSMVTSIVVLVLTAAMREGEIHMAYAHMSIAAAVCISFALIYVREIEARRTAGASPAELASLGARVSGFVWAWAAIGLMITYGTGLLVWREWLTFTVVCFLLSGLCLVLGDLLGKDATRGQEDQTMLRFGRYLTIGQFVGMLAVMFGLALDGKMAHLVDLHYTDWAANNLFFFGALALASISAYALSVKPRASQPTAAE